VTSGVRLERHGEHGESGFWWRLAVLAEFRRSFQSLQTSNREGTFELQHAVLKPNWIDALAGESSSKFLEDRLVWRLPREWI
jgi:hypothetical protein